MIFRFTVLSILLTTSITAALRGSKNTQSSSAIDVDNNIISVVDIMQEDFDYEYSRHLEPSADSTCEHEAKIKVEIVTDDKPEETSWSIVDSYGETVYAVYPLEYTVKGAAYLYTISGLCRGREYTFIIEDTYGDGICCENGHGGFWGYFEGSIIFSSIAEFGRKQTWDFTLPLPSPTSSPTASPTAGPTADPTFNPTVAPTTAPTAGPTFNPTVAPTTAPTDQPTVSPTKLPTGSPTVSPTSLPTLKPTVECVDNASKDFDIEVDEKIKTKNCAWVASKKQLKQVEYCGMKVTVNGKSKKLSAICKETCGRVGFGQCTPEPTSAPTSSPTSIPTPVPTSSPTSSPTSAPTILCEDKSKEFQIDVDGAGTIKTKDCNWVASKKKLKQEEYCNGKVEINGSNKKLSLICEMTCGLVGEGECAFVKDL